MYFVGRNFLNLCLGLLTTSSNHTYGGAQVDNQALMTGGQINESFDYDEIGERS